MTLDEFLAQWRSTDDCLAVTTSGSTGAPKQMMVEKERMRASARTTCAFLGLRPGDRILNCLSLDYIAGKMMVVRAQTCGLQLTHREPSNHPLAQELDGHYSLLALVPSQVYCTLEAPEETERLKAIDNIIIGGGPVSPQLEARLRDFPNAVWSTYGMTETLSHIALRRLSGTGATLWYEPFDGVEVSLNEENCLVINAPHVCDGELTTNDIAELHNDGRRFRILGRKDNVICSGGVKLQIEEIEQQLAPYIQSPFAISKRKDEKFGEVAVLVVENPSDGLMSLCRKVLPPYSVPKAIIPVPHIPMTETGKIARAEVVRLIAGEIG